MATWLRLVRKPPYLHWAPGTQTAQQSRPWYCPHTDIQTTLLAYVLLHDEVPFFRYQTSMLQYAAVFFVIAIIAAVFGFTGIAAGAASIAKFLFLIFIVAAVISLIVGLSKR
jgi:uncharacterized membrane protein YtjA (UPF0391 family)